jgi:hypothetical protein
MPSVNPGPAVQTTDNSQAGLAPVNSNQNQNPPGQYALRLLAVALNVDANAAAQDNILPVLNSTRYSVEKVVLSGASLSLTTATGGLFTAAAAGGTAIVATAALSGATGPTIVSQRTVASTVVQTGQNLFWRNVVAQGAASNYDIFVYGYDLSGTV